MTEPLPDADDEASRIVQRIQKLAEKGRARAIQEGRAEPPEPPPVAKIIQLPLWPEPVRGAPNASIRSALFAGIHGKDRKTLGHQPKEKGKPLDPVLIAAQTGLTIKYAGLQLNQYDATVFFEALHRARHHPLETECFFHGYDFLKTIHGSRKEGNEGRVSQRAAFFDPAVFPLSRCIAIMWPSGTPTPDESLSFPQHERQAVRSDPRRRARN